MYKEYIEGEHGGQFIGIRIAVMIDNKFHQQYFSFNLPKRDRTKGTMTEEMRNYLRNHAMKIHDKWVTEKAQLQCKRKTAEDAPTQLPTRNSTDIRGITFGWFQCGTRLIARINVYCIDMDYHRIQTTRRVRSSSEIDNAWGNAVKVMSKSRGFKDVPKEWYKLKPSISDFNLRLESAQSQLNVQCYIPLV